MMYHGRTSTRRGGPTHKTSGLLGTITANGGESGKRNSQLSLCHCGSGMPDCATCCWPRSRTRHRSCRPSRHSDDCRHHSRRRTAALEERKSAGDHDGMRPNWQWFRARVSIVEPSSKMRHADTVTIACPMFARNKGPPLPCQDRQHSRQDGQREPTLRMVEARARRVGVAMHHTIAARQHGSKRITAIRTRGISRGRFSPDCRRFRCKRWRPQPERRRGIVPLSNVASKSPIVATGRHSKP